MTAGLRIHVDGLDAALGQLKDIRYRLGAPTPMWQAIGAHLEAKAQQRFLDEREPSGNPWPKSLRALATGGRTLTDTARLMQSITANATQDGVEVGSNVLYAAIQQFGGTITAKTPQGLRWKYKGGKGRNREQWARKQSVTLPPRPFIGLEQDDPSDILAIAVGFIGGDGHDAH